MLVQVSLKPQDIVVSLKIALTLSEGFTYASAATELGLAPSQIHRSVKMLAAARLLSGGPQIGVAVNRARLLELLVHGVPSFFPPVIGGPTRGMATIYTLEEMRQQLNISKDSSYVWPDPTGESRGTAIAPLHACVLKAAPKDLSLYRALMAVDALRLGDAREREIAIGLLNKMLK